MVRLCMSVGKGGVGVVYWVSFIGICSQDMVKGNMNIICFVFCNFKIFNKCIKNIRVNKFFVVFVILFLYGKMDMEIELMI